MPGSGISHTFYLIKNNEDDEKTEKEPAKHAEKSEDRPKRRRRRTSNEQASLPWGSFVFMLVAVFFIYLGANAFGLLPPNLVTNFLSTLTQWARPIGL